MYLIMFGSYIVYKLEIGAVNQLKNSSLFHLR